MNILQWMMVYCFGMLVQILHGEIFSSVYKLSILAKEEGKLLRALRKYTAARTKEGEIIPIELQRISKELEPLVSVSCWNPSYAENPINAFHLISRFVYKWPVVYSNILCESCDIDEHALYLNTTFGIVNANIIHWPGEYDVRASAEALLRLRVFYYFDIDQLIQGRIMNEVVQPLNPSQVMKIIQLAEEANMLHEARLWCDSLVRQLPFNSRIDESINLVTVSKRLASIFNKAGMPTVAAEVLREMINLGYSDIDNDYNNYKNLSNARTDIEMFPLLPDEYDCPYKQLCRGDAKDAKEMSELYCYLSNTSIPYYKGKVEVVNLRPKIVLFHDVLSETEANHLRDLGSKRFERSTVIEKGNYRSVADSIRVSQTAWLSDISPIITATTNRVGFLTGLNTKSSRKLSNTEAFQIVNYGVGGMYHPHKDQFEIYFLCPNHKIRAWVFDTSEITEAATNRVGLLTGLNSKSAEQLSNTEAFQVVNYGIGGMYHPHTDYFEKPLWGPVNTNDPEDLRGSGDRIATWMYYLNDVTAGGATVFPKLRARVPVVKGGAAFWYNLLPNGNGDHRTLHAGCPVVIGSKWIANKWVREVGQMFTRPCELKP